MKQIILASAIKTPSLLLQIGLQEWDLLIRQARRANLLASLAKKISTQGLFEKIPHQVRWHLLAALRLAQRQEVAIKYEVDRISNSLAESQEPIILLKGAAYVMANKQAAQGRTFSDVDILVPKKSIDYVESELLIHGWQAGKYDAYDQRYYRRWMHEIPPLRHVKRGTTIDVHHSILPDTAKIKVDIQAMMNAAVPISGFNNVYVFNAVDMFLHSATHLFHEGNFEKGLRDLVDLDALMTEFAQHPQYWNELVPRAVQLGLTRPLYYGLRYTHLILRSAVPQHVLADASIGKPNFFIAMLMDALFINTLRPQHPSVETRRAALARLLLYIRSHFLKMPLHLLIYHLSHKAFIKSDAQVEN